MKTERKLRWRRHGSGWHALTGTRGSDRTVRVLVNMQNGAWRAGLYPVGRVLGMEEPVARGVGTTRDRAAAHAVQNWEKTLGD